MLSKEKLREIQNRLEAIRIENTWLDTSNSFESRRLENNIEEIRQLRKTILASYTALKQLSLITED